jgi:rhodanese-related sulfurtransferase
MVASVSPVQLAERLRNAPSDVVLLDVREPDEREYARIEPSMHIPLYEIARRVAEIPRDREVVVYCHSGSRSAMVAGYLESQGFDRVANLTGGIDAWSRRVDPSVPRYG